MMHPMYTELVRTSVRLKYHSRYVHASKTAQLRQPALACLTFDPALMLLQFGRIRKKINTFIEPVSFQNTLLSVISFDLYDPVLYNDRLDSITKDSLS